jgi:hypothetical protein
LFIGLLLAVDLSREGSMKDLITNFSWDRLISLPPTEFLAISVLAALALIALGLVVSFVMSFFD